MHGLSRSNLGLFYVRVDSKEAQKGKTSFRKETVENADLHKAILNKAITTQE